MSLKLSDSGGFNLKERGLEVYFNSFTEHIFFTENGEKPSCWMCLRSIQEASYCSVFRIIFQVEILRGFFKIPLQPGSSDRAAASGPFWPGSAHLQWTAHRSSPCSWCSAASHCSAASTDGVALLLTIKPFYLPQIELSDDVIAFSCCYSCSSFSTNSPPYVGLWYTCKHMVHVPNFDKLLGQQHQRKCDQISGCYLNASRKRNHCYAACVPAFTETCYRSISHCLSVNEDCFGETHRQTQGSQLQMRKLNGLKVSPRKASGP